MSKTYFAYEESNGFDCPASWNESSGRKELLRFLQDNWEQREALFEDENKLSNQQYLTIDSRDRLRTNNYIGTISYNGNVLNIFPKVFRTTLGDPKIEDLVRNLVQWLDYCNKLDPRYLPIESDMADDSNLKELFITLFVKKLELVFERGYYFSYEEQEEDLNIIRGKFDVTDYVTRKIPNGEANRFHCEYSSFEFDNLLNRIIKSVCLIILREGTRPFNERKLRNLLSRLADVKDIKCSAKDCLKVRLNRMQRGYLDILSMCKMFLLNQEPTYSLDNNSSFCFLFPTELLFEGFIGGFLSEVLKSKGGTVKLQETSNSLVNNIFYAGKSYGSAFGLRPDILCTIGDAVFLMDTKYKRIERFETAKKNDELWKYGLINGVKQDDLYQASIYAVKRGLEKAYLIYPLDRYEDTEPDMPVLQEIIFTGKELEDIKSINIILMRVPFVFEEDIEKTKNELRNVLLKAFETSTASVAH